MIPVDFQLSFSNQIYIRRHFHKKFWTREQKAIGWILQTNQFVLESMCNLLYLETISHNILVIVPVY